MAPDAIGLSFRARGATARARLRAAATVLLVLAASARGSGSDAQSPYAAKAALLSARSLLDAHTRAGLERALTRALEKLASAECRRVLLDFRDGAKRTLQENLSSAGRSAGQLFDDVSFRDGSGSGACGDRTVLAWTHPGGSVVYLCSRQFARTAFLNTEAIANILIHEGLHCLGLGENPPAAGAITARVEARCHGPFSPVDDRRLAGSELHE